MNAMDCCNRLLARSVVSALLLLGLRASALPAASPHQDAAVEERLGDDQRRALGELRLIDPSLTVSWDARGLVPRSLAGKLSAPSSASADRIALDFVRANQNLFRIADAQQELAEPVVQRDRDQPGMAHVRLAQLHGKLPVFGSELRVHVDAAGVITSVEAELLPAPSVGTLPALSGAASVELAVADLGTARASAAPELTVFDPGSLTGAGRDERLAWRVMLSSAAGEEWAYFVDAQDGSIAYKYRNSHEARDRRIHAYSSAANCEIGVQLYDEAGPLVPNPGADAASAYSFTADTYGYYQATFGRDSFDDAGAPMIAVVGWPAANAGWTNCGVTKFGVGWATKDVVAHEWQHAVTQYSANMVYTCQPGALNESLSDVFGAMVDRNDWLLGEDLPQGYLRSLADPTVSRPPQPDTNAGASQCAGVHHNSGIPNKVAYLVADGGVHYGIPVAGLGRAALERIWYRALTFHMGSGSKFADAREATINAAAEIHGAGSAAVCSVTNAWASVAVGSACAASANNALFVSQSVPASMVAGQQYGVSVTMRNTGTTTWTTAAGYKLGSQNPQDNQTWGRGRVALPSSVAPGAQVTFSFSVTAPASAGPKNFQWRMLRDTGSVTWFGEQTPNRAIVVQPAAGASASVVWIQPAEETWGVPGTLTAAGFATNGTGNVQLVWRERADNGTWGAWQTVGYQPPPAANGGWSNTISSGNPTNRCHWFDAYVNYSGVTSAVFHYTGWSGCP